MVGTLPVEEGQGVAPLRARELKFIVSDPAAPQTAGRALTGA